VDNVRYLLYECYPRWINGACRYANLEVVKWGFRRTGSRFSKPGIPGISARQGNRAFLSRVEELSAKTKTGGETMQTRRMATTMAILGIAGQMILAADETEINNGEIRATVKDGCLTDVRVESKTIFTEFGRVYVNQKGKRETGMPLSKFIRETEKSKDKGDRFIMHKGIVRAGSSFVAEFGQVWAERKGGSVGLTLHPTYFQGGYGLKDKERPWHMDVVSTIDKKLWSKCRIRINGKYVTPTDIKDYPANIEQIQIPVKRQTCLILKPLNMPNSFMVKENDNFVQLCFSDQEAQTAGPGVRKTPSSRLSLKVEKTE